MPSPITLIDAQSQLSVWLSANLALAQGQSYTIELGGSKRTLTRVNSKEVIDQINFWTKQINLLNSGQTGINTKYVVSRTDL